jgi:hypothetical protein
MSASQAGRRGFESHRPLLLMTELGNRGFMAALTISKIRFAAIAIIVFIPFQFSAAIPGKVPHPMSVGLSFDAAKMLPWDSSKDLGYGPTLHYQFDFTKTWSLISSIGYIYIGEDRHVPDYPGLESTTIKLHDIPVQVGMKKYLVSGPISPFLSLTFSAHNLRKKYKFADGIDPQFESGYSLSFGYDIQFKPCYYFVSEICMHAFDYYSYPVLRLGIRYHFKDSY